MVFNNTIGEPGFLYHGSPKINIKTLKPVPSTILNDEAAVFAGELWIGIVCTRVWSDKDIRVGKVNDRPYISEVYKDAFSSLYTLGGWLYTVSNKTFIHDKRLTNFEYISHSEVPILKMEYVQKPLVILKNIDVNIIYYKERLKSIDW